MTVKITATSIKADNVDFPEYNETFEAYLTTNYVNAGKLVSKETIKTKINESDSDMNRRELIMVFNSAASFNEFQADPVRIAARATRDAYFNEHSITTTDTSVEYIAPDVAPV